MKILGKHKARTGKGQLSLELIVILAVMLSVFAVIFLSASSSVSMTRTKVYHDQTRIAVDMLVGSAERVHASGVGAKQSVLIRLPETITAVQLGENYVIYTLAVRSGNTQDVYGQFSMNVSGALPSHAGRHRVVVESTASGVVFSS